MQNATELQLELRKLLREVQSVVEDNADDICSDGLSEVMGIIGHILEILILSLEYVPIQYEAIAPTKVVPAKKK